MILVMPCYNKEGLRRLRTDVDPNIVMLALETDVSKAYRDCCVTDQLPSQNVHIARHKVLIDQPEEVHLIILMPVPDQSLTRSEEEGQAVHFKNTIDDEFGGHLQQFGLHINLKINVVPVYRAPAS